MDWVCFACLSPIYYYFCSFVYFQTPVEISEILKAKLAETNYKLSNYYGWVYDTAWALAVGLNNSLRFLNDSGLKDYTNNPYYFNAILNGIRKVNFAGMSVSV